MKAGMNRGIKSGAALLAGCLLAGLLAGCGQKGPLYPPDGENAIGQTAADEQAAPDAADEPTDAAEPTDASEPAEAADR